MADANHQRFMEKALLLAKKAEQQGEVPIGAVIVYEDEIIGKGWNQSIRLNDPTAHAEIIAIRNAATNIKNYRLNNCTLYVTLEPCSMCAGSLIHARINEVIFAAEDKKAGAVTSEHHLLDSNNRQHQVKWQGGILATECSELLSNFFKKRRTAKKLKI